MPTLPITSINCPTNHVETAGHSARERLTWIVELMNRFAYERLESHESPRLAAAIVTHLKALASETAAGAPLGETVNHWPDTREPILDRQVALHKQTPAFSPSLQQLVTRARFG